MTITAFVTVQNSYKNLQLIKLCIIGCSGQKKQKFLTDLLDSLMTRMSTSIGEGRYRYVQLLHCFSGISGNNGNL